MADANGIDLAVSNPSFELWLLLHFATCGMQHRHKIAEMLEGYVPGYDKGVSFNSYKDGYLQAVARARRLAEEATSDGEPYRNPTTGVYRLTELIRTG